MAGDNRERLKGLFEIFEDVFQTENKSITGKYLNKRISEKMGVNCDRKAIYKDIAVLNDISQFTIEYDSKINAYRISKKTILNLEEAEIIENALITARFIKLEDTKGIIEKLYKISDLDKKKDLLTRRVMKDRIKVGDTDITESIGIIRQAIKENKKIKFQYCKYNMNKNGKFVIKKSEYIVSPYVDVWFQDFYYLLGNFEGNVISHYRIDRMKTIKMIDEGKRESVTKMQGCNNGFNVDEYMSKLVGMSSGTKERVRISFGNENINEVIDYFGQNVAIINNGNNFILDTQVITNKKFKKWILGFGDRAVIEEPKRLRDEIIHSVLSLKNKYNI